MDETYIIFFGNSKVLDGNDRQCKCFSEFDALCVFDALCRQFLRVDCYVESTGKILRSYDNI